MGALRVDQQWRQTRDARRGSDSRQLPTNVVSSVSRQVALERVTQLSLKVLTRIGLAMRGRDCVFNRIQRGQVGSVIELLQSFKCGVQHIEILSGDWI